MARTRTEVESELDAIKKAIGSGALMVRFADRQVTYRSMAEMTAAKASLEDELADFDGSRVKRVRFTSTKGL